MPILTARDIVHRDGEHEVLRGVSLGLEQGEILGVIGPSGPAIPLLASIMAGLTVPTSGRVELLGARLPSPEHRGRIGFMPEADGLYVDLTAHENFEFFGALQGLSRAELRSASADALAATGLRADSRAKVGGYSSGDRRRLSLAIALLHRPELLVLNMPTAGLDPLERDSVWGSFTALAKKGVAFVIATDLIDEAERCDRLALLKNGELVVMGSPSDLKMRASTTSMDDAYRHFMEAEGGDRRA